jgi:LysR family glycine cleavage system transcriptional activator
MNLPPANALRAFEAAARLASVSRAGDELNVTHAAISHHIRHLEDWFGTKLFRKEGRNIALTEHGAGAVRDPDRQLPPDRGRVPLDPAGSHPAGLTIACIPSIASRWLIPLLADFQAGHPNLDLRVIYAKASDRLADFDADVLITLTAGDEAGTTNRKLFSRINRPVASPHYLARMTSREPSGYRPRQPTARRGYGELDALVRESGRSAHARDEGPDLPGFQSARNIGHRRPRCRTLPGRGLRPRDRIAGDVVVLSDIATMETRAISSSRRSRTRSEVGAFVDWFIASVRSVGHDNAGAISSVVNQPQ